MTRRLLVSVMGLRISMRRGLIVRVKLRLRRCHRRLTVVGVLILCFWRRCGLRLTRIMFIILLIQRRRGVLLKFTGPLILFIGVPVGCRVRLLSKKRQIVPFAFQIRCWIRRGSVILITVLEKLVLFIIVRKPLTIVPFVRGRRLRSTLIMRFDRWKPWFLMLIVFIKSVDRLPFWRSLVPFLIRRRIIRLDFQRRLILMVVPSLIMVVLKRVRVRILRRLRLSFKSRGRRRTVPVRRILVLIKRLIFWL